jgi:tetratricopeptide (TPR) repeat protein
MDSETAPVSGQASEPPPDFFISRAGASAADVAISGVVRDILFEAGYRVVLQQFDFKNHNFMERMDSALASGAKVIAILSNDYLASEYCTAEWYHPLIGDPLNKLGRLIVLRVAECAPRGLLRGIAYCDLVGLRENPALLPDVVLAAVDPEARARLPVDLAGLWRKPGIVIDETNIRFTPGFTGRVGDLIAIDDALREGATAAVVAVHGMGGVGKSTVAREYAWEASQNPNGYAGIWWLDAETDKTARAWPGIEAGLVALGAVFNRSIAEAKNREEAARQALEDLGSAGFSKPWLLIYDNLDDTAALDEWKPPGNVRVIVTSREAKWRPGELTPIRIGVWPRADAIRFLRQQSGRTEMTNAEAESIAQALGDLPLALTHAAAYLLVNDIATPESYLVEITQHMAEVPHGVEGAAARAVFATLRQNVEQAEKRSAGASAVLSLAAYFAPDDIPVELFQQAADIYPGALRAFTGDRVKLEKALGALAQLSLVVVNRENRTFSVHRLVQAAARDMLGGEAGTWVAAAVAALNAAHPGSGDFKHWTAVERLLPHARAAAELAGDATGELLGRLLNWAAFYLHDRAAYDLAEPLYQRTLSIFEKALGPDHPDVGRVLSNLAELHRGQGDYDLAESLYKRTKSIFETALGPESVQARSVRSALAELNRAQGKFDIAEAEPRLPSASKESPRKRYVYLSWTRADKQAALFVRDELVRAGIEVWINIDILPGASWADEAQRAIEESICIVALWSAAAAHSPWVRKEIGFGEGAGKLFVLATDEEPAEIPGLLMRRLRPSDSGAGEPDYETDANRAELRRLAAEIRRLVEADRKGPVP